MWKKSRRLNTFRMHCTGAEKWISKKCDNQPLSTLHVLEIVVVVKKCETHMFTSLILWCPVFERGVCFLSEVLTWLLYLSSSSFSKDTCSCLKWFNNYVFNNNVFDKAQHSFYILRQSETPHKLIDNYHMFYCKHLKKKKQYMFNDRGVEVIYFKRF